MGKFLWLTLLAAAGVAFYLGKNCCRNKKSTDFSVYRADGWFGAESGANRKKDSTEIRPFKVQYPDSALQDLKRRLADSRFVDHIAGTHFTYGFNSDYLRQVAEYWRTKYDWRRAESELNSRPQFLTQIEGIDIHFVRIPAARSAKTVIPLLVVHGWPGSVLEYYKTFPLLSEPDPTSGLAFEVIAPSIPGYGYSEAPHQPGFNVTAAARIFAKLMTRLGHERYVVHGGDWGNFIAHTMAVIYPERIIGAHLLGNWDAMQSPESFCMLSKIILGQYFPRLFFAADSVDREYAKLYPLSKTIGYMLAETGYMHIQATKPDTVAAALVDSPIGLAAYILEKFSTWTDAANREHEDGALTRKFTLDELLTNVMIYWMSGNIAASQRFYKENIGVKSDIQGAKLMVPAGTVDTPHEMIRTPRVFVERNYANLVQYSEFPRGGHFTAFEEPKLVADDIRSFVSKVLEQQAQLQREHDERLKDDDSKKNENKKSNKDEV